jgi:hypothetical protein
MATQIRNSRLIRDYKLITTHALPNNTNHTSDTLDIGDGVFNPEELTVEVLVPAISAHTTANNLQIQLYHGDTTTTAAMTAPQPLIECDVLGGAGGSAETLFRFKLPPGTKRYIAFHMIATTDNCSGVTATFTVLV